MSVAPRLVGLVADDLTGATDAAVQFAVEGWSAHVLCNAAARPEIVEGAPCLLAVVTGVRAARNDEAAAGTARAVQGLLARGCDRLYVKIDSTMRGSVAGQLRGALAGWAGAYPTAIVVLSPAFPDEGRAVVEGVVRVDGRSSSSAAVAADPITPVVESRLDRLVPGATAAVPADLGSAQARDAVGSDRARVVFVDASTDADLDDIAAGLDRLGPRAVAAGSAGLAAAVARLWSAARIRGTGTPVRPSDAMLIGVSSLHPNATESVERLREALACRRKPGGPAVDLISTPARPADDATAVAAGFAAQVAERIGRASYDTLVLVGGDGAAAALNAVGAEAIRVHAALAPGIPMGAILGGAAHGVRVVTKSGAFGGSDSLLRIVDRLQSSSSTRKEHP
jgi:D-threonate/D-erythronate kinase